MQHSQHLIASSLRLGVGKESAGCTLGYSFVAMGIMVVVPTWIARCLSGAAILLKGKVCAEH